MKKNKETRYKYRYNNYKRNLSNLKKEEELYLSKENPTYKDKSAFGACIKFIGEYGWKTMRDYIKYNGRLIFMPKKVIIAMNKYTNTKNWLRLLNDIINFITTREEQYLDIIIENYFDIYKNMFNELCIFFETKADELAQNKMDVFKFEPLKNNSILDSYTFNLFINYFSKNTKVEKVWIIGSRAENTFRESSDIDMIIKGNFDNKEYMKILNDLESLRHPYFIDAHNFNEHINENEKIFIEENLEHSVIFFDRADFI